MLILTRRPGESIIIADEVMIAILGVRQNQVRVGVKAPKCIPVHREEVYRRIRAEERPLLQITLQEPRTKKLLDE